jgi:hypothetical protein
MTQLEEKIKDSNAYYEACSLGNTICFDSGEYSHRSRYILEALHTYLTVKGKAAVVLSDVNPEKTKYYFAKLPEVLKNKILKIGLFHTYLKVTTKVRGILNDLYLSINNLDVIIAVISAVRLLTAKLIKALKQVNITCILDRSPVSTFLYYKSLRKEYDLDNLSYFEGFKPHQIFYIQSENSKDKNFKYSQLYDSLDDLNQDINFMATKLRDVLPITILSLENTLEENIHKMKQLL